ncbi:MAG: hypothetical protein ACK5II_01285 [Paracoccus sp. (in: a-proteobacteria)]
MLDQLGQGFDNICVIAPLPYLTNDFRGGIPAALAGIPGHSINFFINENSELLEIFNLSYQRDGVRVIFPHTKLCSSGAGRKKTGVIFIPILFMSVILGRTGSLRTCFGIILPVLADEAGGQ